MAKVTKTTKSKTKTYNADSIQIMGTMQALRSKMGMYLGGRGSEARFQTLKEVVDNAADEFIQGRGSHIRIIIDSDNLITVTDTAKGIPVAPKVDPETGKKINSLTAILTKTHAGGKFSSGAYNKGSKGTHGIGVKATNAVSITFKVWTYYKNTWWHQSFKLGKPTTPDPIKAKPPKVDGKTPKLGTVVQYKLDDATFEKGSKLPLDTVQSYLDLLSYLHAGLHITLKTPKETKVYQQKDGIKALLKETMARKKVEPLGNPMFFQTAGVDCALQWSEDGDEQTTSYVNGSRTINHGTHVRGFLDAMNEAIKPYKGKRDFTPDDLRAGMYLILNVEVVEPEFRSQVKDELATADAKKTVYDVALPAITEFFKKNKTFVGTLMKRAEDMKKLRETFTASKKATAALRNTKARFALSNKYSAAKTKDTKKIELYLVEGDSAGGTAKGARDDNYQAVLKLKGKPLNPYGPSSKKFWQNEEVLNILRAIGYEGDAPGKALKLRVGKIIVLTDPDVDGKHISVLVMSVLQRAVPSVFADTMVYLVKAPLYIARTKAGIVSGDTLKEVQAALGKEKARDGIKRLKGWGEAEPEELEILAMNADSRKLIQIEPITGAALREYAGIVGENPAARKALIGL